MSQEGIREADAKVAVPAADEPPPSSSMIFKLQEKSKEKEAQEKEINARERTILEFRP